MRRVVLKDFTFSDGTFLPRGSVVSAAMQPMHHDEEVYPDPEAFNPWRFSDKRAQKGEEMKHQLVTTNSEYITFGHGRHAWYVSFCASPARVLNVFLSAPVVSSPRMNSSS